MARDRPDAESLRLRSTGGEIPLGFVEEGDRVHLVARDGAARWPLELLRTGSADLRLAEGGRTSVPRLVSDPAERERILALFRQKYGDAGFARWYAHPRRIISVGPATATARADYFQWLEDEFDNIADEYDRHITGNRMNRLLRDRSLGLLRPTFTGRKLLLEVGCGSGMETIPMLEAGHEIVAVDISDRMLEVVRRKARERGIAERFYGIRGRASELGQLLNGRDYQFAGAYSTYGALNCEPDLAPFVRGLARALPAGSPFVAGIYNRWCGFELGAYGLTFRWARALGRRVNPVPVGASRFCVDTYAYSAPEFAQRFSPAFRAVTFQGVPVLLPPSDLTGYSEKLSRHFATLAAADRWVGGRWPFSLLGDHFLAVMTRTQSGAS